MANKHKDINPDKLLEMAVAYCDECIGNTKQQMSASGKVVEVKHRHIPTIGFFLSHWLRKKDFDFYSRGNWYVARNNNTHPLCDTIRTIDEVFKDLAIDIVANAQPSRGVFYAKNRLGMSDQQQIQTEGKIEIVFVDNEN